MQTGKIMSKILSTIILLFLSATPIAAQIRSDFDRSMNKPVEPFKIVDNIYYVGASDVAVYLITTPKGHILIDGGLLRPFLKSNPTSKHSALN
jgi:metallo-beta-lactamase class B